VDALHTRRQRDTGKGESKDDQQGLFLHGRMGVR
jgi:hypothetical protein